MWYIVSYTYFQPVIIEKAGYPIEIHTATTDDGYILEIHRIPHGSSNVKLDRDEVRPVVLVQHCILCSSADFVIPYPSKALGIISKETC